MGPFGGEIFDPFTAEKAVGKAIQIALLWTLLIQLPMTIFSYLLSHKNCSALPMPLPMHLVELLSPR